MKSLDSKFLLILNVLFHINGLYLSSTNAAQVLPVQNFLPLLEQWRFENDKVFTRILDQLTNATVYDTRIRPNATSGNPTVVETSLYLRDISSIDELAFQYTADIDLMQQWEDERLVFEKRTDIRRNGTFLTARGPAIKKIWTPDVYFENEKKGAFHELIKRNEQMRIFSNGTILYKVRMSLTFSCYMELQNYPMDTQTCKMRLGSYAYSLQDVRFKWKTRGDYDGIKVNNQFNMPKFELKKYYTGYCSISTGDGISWEYTCLDAFVVLQRQFSFHLIQTYIPTILLVVASWMSFWIDPNAVPARVAIGVTTLLTMITMTTAVRYNLPPVSYIKSIDVWMFVCIFYVFSAMIEYAIMNVAMQRHKNKQTMLPDCLENCLKKLGLKGDKVKDEEVEMVEVITDDGNVSTISLSSNGTISKKSKTIVRHRKNGKIDTPAPAPAKDSTLPASMNIDRMARFFFPITFGIFLIVYWSKTAGKL